MAELVYSAGLTSKIILVTGVQKDRRYIWMI